MNKPHFCYLFFLLFCASLIGGLAGCQKKKQEFRWVNPPQKSLDGLQHIVLNSDAMGHDVGISILLPQTYDPSNEKQTYPVLYYLHGWGGHESSDVVGIRDFLANALGQAQVSMPIVVYPNGGKTGYFGPIETMITQELVPYIDHHFNTVKVRDGRLLMGFSVGGTAAARLALRYPQMFKTATSVGGRLWSRDNSLPDAIQSNHERLNQLGSHVQFIQGDQDRAQQFDDVFSIMNQYGVAYEFHLLKNTNHNLSLYLAQSTKLYGHYLHSVMHPSRENSD